MEHHISIAGHPGNYSTTGAVSITASATPILDAAKSLLKHGASPLDTIAGAFSDCGLIAPVALARVVMPRRPAYTATHLAPSPINLWL